MVSFPSESKEMLPSYEKTAKFCHSKFSRLEEGKKCLKTCYESACGIHHFIFFFLINLINGSLTEGVCVL